MGTGTRDIVNSITIKQLLENDYISTPRNRQIAKTVKEMGWIERYGTGIRRVKKMFLDYGLTEPKYQIISGGMAVTVYGLAFEKVDEKGTEMDIVGEVVEESSEKSSEENSEKIQTLSVKSQINIFRSHTYGMRQQRIIYTTER